jgi:hypothetical protein
MMTRRLGPDGPVKHLPPQATSFASSAVLKDEQRRPESDERGAPPEATSFGRIVRVIGNWPGDDSDL